MSLSVLGKTLTKASTSVLAKLKFVLVPDPLGRTESLVSRAKPTGLNFFCCFPMEPTYVLLMNGYDLTLQASHTIYG